MDSSKNPDDANSFNSSPDQRKPSKVSYSDMDLSKDPYSTRLPKHKTTVFYGSNQEAEFRHLVIGHSQVRNKWNVVLPENELNFPMDWISVSGGKARDLAGEIVYFLQTYQGKQPLRISAVIWQNSVENESLDNLKNIVWDIQEELDQHPEHKVAFPTLHFIPQQESSWEKIGKLNDFLREVNINNGLNPYNMHKSTMRMKKGEGLRVQQSAFEEFKAGTGKGYHIAESRYPAYVRVIKKYHQTGFRDHEGAKEDHQPRETTEIKFMPTGDVKMQHPRHVDLRRSLNDIRSRKREEYGKDDMIERSALMKKIATDSVEDEHQKADDQKHAGREEMRQDVVKKIVEEIHKESKRKQEEEKEKEEWVEEKRRTLQKMNKRLMQWENHGRLWEETLVKQERDLDAKEREMEMREAELQKRHMDNLERFKASDLKLKVATVEKELELAKIELERKRIMKLAKVEDKRQKEEKKSKEKKKK